MIVTLCNCQILLFIEDHMDVIFVWFLKSWKLICQKQSRDLKQKKY
ncbi:unnamed protein product (macronuclear) [Paramecium tetraurelia]|uniref:Uncharacterized protein n=1 Tax=Paramecium tetraurelia TaxID=5888 RepID=A0BU41_PARTE|nr:uncharacterized protein GSPATT00032290001 [Paramecium tetraurelia]CAK62058.1 unnamed protein product [Paramecium tetraurelia]